MSKPDGSGDYRRGALALAFGIAATGLLTFAYFSVASYTLDRDDYGQLTLLWSVLFVTVSVIYRPVEQLLSRTIAQREARGETGGHPLRVPITIQAGLAAAFALSALLARDPLQNGLFGGSATLYWVLVAAALFYSASYFARGWLAGQRRFGLYGALVFFEAFVRLLFPLAVALGIAHGQTVVALGIAAAPLISLVLVPLAFTRGRGGTDPAAPATGPGELDVARGGRFALAALVIMLAEQTLLNGAVIVTEITGATAVALVFNVLLVARIPLQLFQAIQGSLLPHLAGLQERGDAAQARRAVRVTVLAIAGFALLVAVALVALGPWAMTLLFGDSLTYPRWGLALVALGMGFHLMAGTLTQVALARDRAGRAAVAWLIAAAAFVLWLFAPVVGDGLLRAEVGYLGAAALLCALLGASYRRESR